MSRTAPFPPGPADPLAGLPESNTDYDALAELFLGQEQTEPPVKPATATRPPLLHAPAAPRALAPIEGLILGHLPVMASAWVQQYARHLSGERGGPVALVRLRAGEAQIDLVGHRVESGPPHVSLESAVHDAARHAAAWLIRVDETTEPRLLELRGLSAVTLLTSADEVAVTSAYRTLKGLVHPADEGEGPDLRVTIMGAAPEKAAEATSKLERAAAAFLDRPIRVAHCIARIGGKPSNVLFRGSWTGTVDELVVAIQAEHRRPSPISAPSPAISLEPSAPVAIAPPAITTPPVSKPSVNGADAVVSRLGRLHAAPGGSPAPCGPLVVHLPGLRGVELACPYAPGVEFAVDDRGAMHILGRPETADPSPLMIAAAWVRAHQNLLRVALSSTIPGYNPEEPPVQHLFAEDARKVRALGDSAVRLHLLARVEAGGNTTWFSTPLN